mmetsp:Transcript_57054/g.64641  ORF Transcript_57054/g.64641 Transcript_57054/m.64641 type:complete len:121 (-) Transcript_57054:161-523(-)
MLVDGGNKEEMGISPSPIVSKLLLLLLRVRVLLLQSSLFVLPNLLTMLLRLSFPLKDGELCGCGRPVAETVRSGRLLKGERRFDMPFFGIDDDDDILLRFVALELDESGKRPIGNIDNKV